MRSDFSLNLNVYFVVVGLFFMGYTQDKIEFVWMFFEERAG